MTDKKEGLGDDQGARVGTSKEEEEGKSTGMGSEATEGIHGADGNRKESHRSALEGKTTGTSQERAGSEPIESHDREHRSSYGGGSRPEES